MNRWTRRGFFSASLATAAWSVRAAGAAPPSAKAAAAGEARAVPEDRETAKNAQARFAQAGLRGSIEHKQTAQFQGLGNAAPAFIAAALTLCERLGKDYRDHFAAKSFVIEPPKAKMTVVVLADLASFNGFLGQDFGPETGGIYDIAANWLIMFDNRAQGAQANAQAERVNSFVLMHEAFHLLNYNTGLLNRAGDAPLCISEGLGAYAETRRADGKTPIGRVNEHRLQALALALRGGEAWLPLSRLLTENALFEADDASQRAYAQSWILIHELMSSKTSAAKLRAYLDAIRPRQDAAQRLTDAQAHLGDLAKLDENLRKSAARMLKRL